MSGNLINSVSLSPTTASSIPSAARKDSPVSTGSARSSEPTSVNKTDKTSNISSANQAESKADTKATTQVSNEQLEAAASTMSDYAKSMNRNLDFTIDEDSGQTVIKIIDTESDEVIRQIPNEDALEMAKRMQEYADSHDSGPQEGLLLKTQA